MNVPPIKPDESLAMWRSRLAEHFKLSPVMEEIVRVVSIQSYIMGTEDMTEAFKS